MLIPLPYCLPRHLASLIGLLFSADPEGPPRGKAPERPATAAQAGEGGPASRGADLSTTLLPPLPSTPSAAPSGSPKGEGMFMAQVQ